MKYQININQLALADSNLDLIDAAILDYLIFYCNSRSPKIEERRVVVDGEKYTWIKYDNIIEDMPMLRIKEKKALTKRIVRLVEDGYIKTHRENNIRQYYLLTEKTEHLYLTPDSSLWKDRPVDENTQVGGTKVHSPVHQSTHDKDTIDKDTNDKTVNGKKSLLIKLPSITDDKDYIEYVSEMLISALGDKHSKKFYQLVAAKVPEGSLRQILAEIKADGAENPAKVFTYRMNKFALTKSL